MKNTLTFRTGAWYADVCKEFPLPGTWEPAVYRMPELPALGAEGIGAALDAPIGTGSIEKEAKGAKDACIIVDDLSRPTPAAQVCLAVMDRLNTAGIPDKKIRLLVGGGTSRSTGRFSG